MEWWTQQDAGLIGGIAGAGLGVLGAMIGSIGVMLTQRGKGKAIVVGVMFVVIALGAAAVVTAIVAAMIGQPFHVWFPLALLGGTSCIVFGSLTPVVIARYRHTEQRRIDARSLRNS